jgi:hypothetical protein
MQPGEISGQVMLCDYAQVHGGKLYVTGAGINVVVTPQAGPGYPINLWAAVLVTVPWNAHNQAHRLEVRLEDQDSNAVPFAQPLPGARVQEGFGGSLLAQFNVGRPPNMQHGDDSVFPLAVNLSVHVPVLGPYRVVLLVDGKEIAHARFRVLHQQMANVITAM